MNRRKFVGALTGFIAAPMIVRIPALLMPVRKLKPVKQPIIAPAGMVVMWERVREVGYRLVHEVSFDEAFANIARSEVLGSAMMAGAHEAPVARVVPFHVAQWHAAQRPQGIVAVSAATTQLVEANGGHATILGQVTSSQGGADGWGLDDYGGPDGAPIMARRLAFPFPS